MCVEPECLFKFFKSRHRGRVCMYVCMCARKSQLREVFFYGMMMGELAGTQQNSQSVCAVRARVALVHKESEWEAEKERE